MQPPGSAIQNDAPRSECVLSRGTAFGIFMHKIIHHVLLSQGKPRCYGTQTQATELRKGGQGKQYFSLDFQNEEEEEFAR